jgi:RecA-family ATPase
LPGFFYADVGILSGSGGTGKTTLALWEMLHIVTARPLYGQVIERPGPVLFVTGEDSRAVVLARLHRIIEAVEPSLNDVEREAVDAGFAIWDVSSDAARLVDIDRTGRIAPTGFADEIITVCQALQPVMVTFDPLISFMPSETRVNDAEQSIIIEARRIVRKTDAMVRFITHVSQNSYRAGVTDQYAARGGTALPDGCRMVSVLTRVLDDSDTPPKTLKTEPDYVVFKLHRPKLSYTPPQPAVWISRAGYRFDFSAELPALPPAAQKAADAHQVLRFLASELSEGRRYTQRAIEDCRDELGMGRDQIRRAITEAQVAGKLKAEPLPPDERQGSRTTFLCPVYCANPPAQ